MCSCRIGNSHRGVGISTTDEACRGVGISTRDEACGSLVEIPIPRVRFPILHGLAHDGLFFSHFSEL